MATARFRELERRLKKLRKRFLPSVSPTGDYTARQLDHTRAYRLLAHAEIEAFLEERCQSVANSTLKQFRIDGSPKLILTSLISFHWVPTKLSEQKLKELYATKAKYPADAAGVATTAYNSMLANNHGIREINLLRMGLPLGLDPADIDPAWLSTLDTFGVNRGVVAHTSIKTQQQIDPQDELKTMGILLQGLEKLDNLIAKLK